MKLAFQGLQSQAAGRRVLSLCCSLALMIGAVGCGGGDAVPKVFTNLKVVTGTVTLNNVPLKGAAIAFTPIGEKGVRPAYGLTDDAGKYELITPVHDRSAAENRGAVPGQYKVTINKLVLPNGSDLPKDQSEAEAMRLGAKESLPASYSDLQRTTLKADVPDTAEVKPIDFALKTK